MSSGVKRAAAPPAPAGERGGVGETGPGPAKKGGPGEEGRSSNGSGPAPLTYSSGDVADDVNMTETAAEQVTLEVVLPSGTSSSSVTVDFNTPMRDLLIHLSATFKVAPTAHVLQLLDPETGKGLEFKPSQTIGALGASTVYIVPKNKKAEWGKAMKASKASKAFEITNRFTINLPGGQKAVMRVSPQLTLEQVFARVCQDKSLDSRRYTLQHPDNPLAPLDLKATIADNRLTEINIIYAAASSSAGQASRSMPNLHHQAAAASSASQNPASWYMPGAGETKKKRGFLSFLSKKDKKFKPHETHYAVETSGPASQPPPPSTTTTLPPPPPTSASTLPRKSTTPPAQRRTPDVSATSPRPKTLYVTSDVSQRADVNPAPGKTANTLPPPSKGGPAPGKKRPAPPPPPQKKKAPASGGPEATAVQATSSSGLSAPSGSKTAKDKSNNVSVPGSVEASATVKAPTAEAPVTVTVKPSPAEGPPQGLSRFHSRNSSDSSGYHELTLSGAESPEASRVPTTLKTSIDTTSIESADHPNGDSGVQDLSPPPGVESSSAAGQPSDRAGSRPGRDLTVKQQQQVSIAGKPETKPKPPPSTKKKKAPPPPPKAKPAPVPGTSAGVASSQRGPPHPTPPTSVPVARDDQSIPPPQPLEEKVAVSAAVPTEHEKTTSVRDHIDGDESDSDSGEAFNLNDILDAVDFEEEPPVHTTTTTTTTTTVTSTTDNSEDEAGRLPMMERASVMSEGPEDIKSRPCEFIPPPPPEEPPPEDYPPPTEYPPPEQYSSASPETQYLDKGTVVGEDNTSLAPASLKGSPDSMYHRRSESRASLASLGSIDTVEGLSLAFAQTIALGEETLESEQWQEEQGYSNEMARFVAQMSRLTTDRPLDGGDLSSNDTSLSLPDTESVSDTGSVVYHGEPQHARGDSKDSQTSLSSVDRPAEASLRDREAGVASAFAVMEEIDAPLETVPPPLEFQGDGEEEEEEEEFTVVTEEYISPVGPYGPDYSAAVKVSEEVQKDSTKSKLGGAEGVFRAEPVSILPSEQTMFEQREEEEPAPKEEFVLTMEDLSSVSLVPPRPKIPVPPKPVLKPALMEPDPQLEVEPGPIAGALTSESIVHDSLENPPSFGYRSEKSDRIFTDFEKPPQESETSQKPGTSGDKPVSTLYLPTMRYRHSVEPITFSDDDLSSVGSSGDHVHHSLAAGSRVADDASDTLSDKPGDADSRRMSSSSEASQTLPSGADLDPEVAREELQHQFGTLQDQFVRWQQQLQQNEAFLASQSSGPADPPNEDTLKTLQAQMQMQQQMMKQLEMSMKALTSQQQQQQAGTAADTAAPHVDIPAPAEDSSPQSSLSPPSYPPPPPPTEPPELPPPPPPPPPATAAPVPKVIKAETKPKSSRASRFEPQLDPREELMIAIRSFGGREHLKAVPTKETKWVHSNK